MENPRSIAKLEAMNNILAMSQNGLLDMPALSMALDAFAHKLDIAKASDKIDEICQPFKDKLKELCTR